MSGVPSSAPSLLCRVMVCILSLFTYVPHPPPPPTSPLPPPTSSLPLSLAKKDLSHFRGPCELDSKLLVYVKTFHRFSYLLARTISFGLSPPNHGRVLEELWEVSMGFIRKIRIYRSNDTLYT